MPKDVKGDKTLRICEGICPYEVGHVSHCSKRESETNRMVTNAGKHVGLATE